MKKILFSLMGILTLSSLFCQEKTLEPLDALYIYLKGSKSTIRKH